MTEVVAVDIGGTHARFTLARLAGRQVEGLMDTCTLKTADHAGLETAWDEFARRVGRALPRAAGIAVAAPINGEAINLTNNPWVIRPQQLAERLGLDRLALLNDFGAVGHAIAQIGPDAFRPVCGPDVRLGGDGVVSVIGPGTGLGVAQVIVSGGRAQVIETEGGHIDWAPLDAFEDNVLRELRGRFRRVSIERLVSGPGLRNLYESLTRIEGQPEVFRDEPSLWSAALAGENSFATAALDRFCLILGAVAGDIALAQGANAVVIAGGLGLRLADVLPRSGFAERFTAKGRFERRMAGIPVKLVTHPQPGLLGAAAAIGAELAGATD